MKHDIRVGDIVSAVDYGMRKKYIVLNIKSTIAEVRSLKSKLRAWKYLSSLEVKI